MFNSRKDSKAIHHYRKMDFVSNNFKRNFVVKLCVVLMLGALISGAIIYGMTKATVTTTFAGGRLKIISTADFILPTVLLSSAVVAAFIGLSVVAIIVFAYHKLEMSLYRVEEEIEKADSGNLDVDLNYRRDDHKKDEFKVLALSLDKLIRDFSNVMDAISNDVNDLENDIKEFETNGSQEIPERMKVEIQKLKDEIGKFKK